ncbi:hypothetical protein B6U66_05140 [Candidatus Bathyarchaeota archaeon ex4484_135]|nr:MAG: hypothetical protein B6U66_05140 [Candidatus Bathyarchaeota archaeon ex4484_135]
MPTLTAVRPEGQAALKTAITAISTALVCVATMAFIINVPATRGYFNLGETMVYTTAILFGPYVGAIAGGLGSALADLLVDPFYAPATLVIKACEGFLVGWLTKKGLKAQPGLRKGLTITMAFLSGSLLASIGARYYSGPTTLTLGPFELEGFVPVSLWVCLGVALAIFITALGFSLEPEAGWLVLSMLLGGSIMVMGYFLYEFAWFGWAALAEVPVNIGQVSVGIMVAMPLTRAVERRVPGLRQA